MLRVINNVFSLFLLLLATENAFAQESFTTHHDSAGTEYYSDNFLRYDNHVYQDNVKTVLLHGQGWQLAPPVIMLNDPGSILELHFDVVDSVLGNYMYSVIHCNADWQPSDLDFQEYIIGNFEDFINDYDYSRNTFQKYIHYKLEIPSFNLQITKSGNYLLKVFDSEDPDKLILTRRFCVSEEITAVEAKVKQATRVHERREKQEVDFSVYQGNYELTNPYSDLKVVVLQNHHWLNAVEGLDPRFIKENVLDYDYDHENTFWGGNEYRMLDIQNTRYPGQGVNRVTFVDQENHAYLEPDKRRSSKVYLERPDLNGWRYIKTNSGFSDGEVDADYVNAHFVLKQDYELQNGDIYVFGALTDWRIQPEAKMVFNADNMQYESTLYLKQGLYNYIYVYVEDGTLEPNMIELEGSHFQTENEYAILVYHRERGWDFDRLLKYAVVRFPDRQD